MNIRAPTPGDFEYEIGARLPWDHLNVKKGRAFLEKEQNRANVQLAAMAGAV